MTHIDRTDNTVSLHDMLYPGNEKFCMKVRQRLIYVDGFLYSFFRRLFTVIRYWVKLSSFQYLI